MLVAKERGKVEDLKKSLQSRAQVELQLRHEVNALKDALSAMELSAKQAAAAKAALSSSDVIPASPADQVELIRTLRGELASQQNLIADLSKLNGNILELKREVDARDTKISSLQETEADLRARLVKALEASATLQRAHLELKEQLQDREEKLEEKEDIIEELNAQLEDLKAPPGPSASPRRREAAVEESPHSPRSRDEFMKRNILQELIKTERDYLDDVRTLDAVILSPLRDGNLLGDETAQEIRDFSMLVSVNEKLLEGLLLDRGEGSAVVKAMSDFVDNALRPYSEYCSGAFAGLSQALLKNSSKWAAYRKKVEADPRLKGLPMEACIIKPVQRICRYPLLLNELRKVTPKEAPEYPALSNLIDKFNDAVHTINDIRREHEMMHRAAELHRLGVAGLGEFEFWGKTRRLLRELSGVPIAIVDFKGQENWRVGMAWMLTDCVVFARRRKKTIMTVVAAAAHAATGDSYDLIAMCRYSPSLSCSSVSVSGKTHVLQFKDSAIETTYLVQFDKADASSEWRETIQGIIAAMKVVQETTRLRRARVEPLARSSLTRDSGSFSRGLSQNAAGLSLSPRGDAPRADSPGISPSPPLKMVGAAALKFNRSSQVMPGRGSVAVSDDSTKTRRSATATDAETRLSSSSDIVREPKWTTQPNLSTSASFIARGSVVVDSEEK